MRGLSILPSAIALVFIGSSYIGAETFLKPNPISVNDALRRLYLSDTLIPGAQGIFEVNLSPTERPLNSQSIDLSDFRLLESLMDEPGLGLKADESAAQKFTRLTYRIMDNFAKYVDGSFKSVGGLPLLETDNLGRLDSLLSLYAPMAVTSGFFSREHHESIWVLRPPKSDSLRECWYRALNNLYRWANDVGMTMTIIDPKVGKENLYFVYFVYREPVQKSDTNCSPALLEYSLKFLADWDKIADCGFYESLYNPEDFPRPLENWINRQSIQDSKRRF